MQWVADCTNGLAALVTCSNCSSWHGCTHGCRGAQQPERAFSIGKNAAFFVPLTARRDASRSSALQVQPEGKQVSDNPMQTSLGRSFVPRPTFAAHSMPSAPQLRLEQLGDTAVECLSLQQVPACHPAQKAAKPAA